MTRRGKLIGIEGIDGSGKGTQTHLLAGALEARGIPCARFSFPRYDSSFGRLVGRFLNGEFGELNTIDPHFSALLYAGDRLEAKNELQSALEMGKTILADRYISSNLAHQTARVAPELREGFLSWLRHVEYDIYGLPAENLIVYLRLTPSEAHRLIAQKEARKYTERKHDLQEANRDHLEQALRMYDALASGPGWVTVECIDPKAGAALKSPGEIHQAVLAAVESRLFSDSQPGL